MDHFLGELTDYILENTNSKNLDNFWIRYDEEYEKRNLAEAKLCKIGKYISKILNNNLYFFHSEFPFTIRIGFYNYQVICDLYQDKVLYIKEIEYDFGIEIIDDSSKIFYSHLDNFKNCLEISNSEFLKKVFSSNNYYF